MASKGIPEKFHPPVTLILPKRMFGSKKVERAFRVNWCQQFPWLHYNIDRDAAFCHVCMRMSLFVEVNIECMFSVNFNCVFLM